MALKRGEEIPDGWILSRLETGDKITLARLAARMKMSEDKVRRKLLVMAAKGQIIRERDGNNRNSPYLFFIDRASITIAGGAFEIPTPFVPVLMTGELTGYASEMNQRAALCMSIRRVA